MDFLRRIFKQNKVVAYTLLSALVFILLNIISLSIYNWFGGPEIASVENEIDTCNVFAVSLHGTMDTYVLTANSADSSVSYQNDMDVDVVGSEDIVSSIQQANRDDSIKAIVLEVDSRGGAPIAGEEVANALKRSIKPTVAIIRRGGLSSAYWAASGAQHIFASKNSHVGDIGITASYLEEISKDKKFIQLSIGKYKDSGNPEKPITEDEKNMLMRDVKIMYQNFIDAVATNRNLPVESVTKIADGSSVLGDKALSLGLIDEIGGWTEAEKYLREKIGEMPDVCW